MKKIGFVGLGDMGMGMAKNLLNAKYEVTGFDLNETRLGNFAKAGGKAAKNNAGVGKESDVVFVMVLNADQAKSVVFGENGLVETMKPGSCIINTATIGIKGIQDIEKQLKEKKIDLIDAAVSGGQSGANAGTLTMMVSSSKKVFDDCLDVLNVVGKDIYHVGTEIGLGQVVKSCMQALVGCTYAATFEMLALGAKAGVNPEILLNVIGTSVVGSTLFKNTTSLIMDRKFTDTGANSAVTYKDLGLTLDLAKEYGVPMITTSVAHEIFRAGITKSPGEDNQCVVKVLEDILGIEIKK